MLARIEIKQAEIDFDVAVGGLQPATGQNALARPHQPRVDLRQSREFQSAISFHRCADLRRALLVDVEPAVGELARQDGFRRLLNERLGGWIPRTVYRRMHPELKKNVV